MAARKHPPQPRTASDRSGQNGNSEFDRFESLTNKLLRVPKKELDEKRKRKS